MTASEQAKAHGLKSLRQMAELTDIKERTLYNWHANNPKGFEVVLLGCKAKLGLVT